MSIDHVVAKCNGGSVMDVDNLQPMIVYFNNAKGRKTDREFRKSLKK